MQLTFDEKVELLESAKSLVFQIELKHSSLYLIEQIEGEMLWVEQEANDNMVHIGSTGSYNEYRFDLTAFSNAKVIENSIIFESDGAEITIVID